AVFCATACLGEDGLRPDAPDAAAQRADRLQEAIQRLADSASRATAAEALSRLRQAMDRVGTEARSRSPLGLATSRLRRVEGELRQLEEVSAEAERRWGTARERLRAAECRRVEIATSIRALGRVPRMEAKDREQARTLAAEVAAEGAVARRAEELRTAEARAA